MTGIQSLRSSRSLNLKSKYGQSRETSRGGSFCDFLFSYIMSRIVRSSSNQTSFIKSRISSQSSPRQKVKTYFPITGLVAISKEISIIFHSLPNFLTKRHYQRSEDVLNSLSRKKHYHWNHTQTVFWNNVAYHRESGSSSWQCPIPPKLIVLWSAETRFGKSGIISEN